MAEQTTGTVGSDAENVVIGRSNRQSTDSRNQNVTFTSQDNLQLWFKLQEVVSDIRDLRGDVRALDLKIDGLPDRVGRLEGLEVVVRPAAGAAAESVNLSIRMIFTILLIVGLTVLVLVAALIYFQVQ